MNFPHTFFEGNQACVGAASASVVRDSLAIDQSTVTEKIVDSVYDALATDSQDVYDLTYIGYALNFMGIVLYM